ncbi:hypothetical protein Axi01nite_67110 [Actinoplanes xinjiangensis]|nr:hypothetical protein Axi01nite_67110 [Actinoplanes xinjiangensis]
MIELATHEVMARRELLARIVRDALAAAGLPDVSPNMSRQLVYGGAEVRVDKLADCHAPVRIEWHQPCTDGRRHGGGRGHANIRPLHGGP